MNHPSFCAATAFLLLLMGRSELRLRGAFSLDDGDRGALIRDRLFESKLCHGLFEYALNTPERCIFGKRVASATKRELNFELRARW